jgi:hypothetical protein
MTPARHTPGPWHYGSSGRVILADTGQQVATVTATPDDEYENSANAQLIAEAPDLLRILKAARSTLACRYHSHSSRAGCFQCELFFSAQETIARAEGRAP